MLRFLSEKEKQKDTPNILYVCSQYSTPDYLFVISQMHQTVRKKMEH
jgi:hypothetical protein